MSDGGKGCKPRPFSVSQEEYDKRWDTIFQRDLPEEEKVEEVKVEEVKDEKEVKIKATIPEVKIKGSVN
jgi:hypothetical protein